MPDIQIIILIALAAALALSLAALIWVIVLSSKLKKMLAGGAENIPESISHLNREVSGLLEYQKLATGIARNCDNRISTSIRAVETVRFNPFKGIGSGGNQSFSTAFLNELGDGIVISGLYYSQDRVSIYAKPLKKFVSEFELTPEEKSSIEKARESLKR